VDNGEIDLWSTHLAVLVACVAKTQGPVLELGCGHYSTRVLHALCGAQGRELTTIDVNEPWVAQFAHLKAPWHRILLVPDIAIYLAAEVIEGKRWSVVFEDSGRAQFRPDNIAAVRKAADLIIVNNTEPGRPVYQYERILPSFPHRWDYKRYPVWTSVVSDSPLPDRLEELT